MKTMSVSSAAIASAAREAILKTQAALLPAQKEVATGRHADMGLALGRRAGHVISLRQDFARITGFVDMNAFATSRLDMTQTVLGEIRTSAEEFLSMLISAPDGKVGALALRYQAVAGLSGLIAGLNTSIGGQYIFGGINSDTPPIHDYFASPFSAGKEAVSDAFQAAFGMSTDDPNVATITAAEMEAFLDGPLADLFDDAGWSAHWSDASSDPMQSRISPTDTVISSISANEASMRKLAMGFLMIADLGAEKLNEAAFEKIVEAATRLVSDGAREIVTMQGRIGAAEARIGQVNERLTLQRDILSREIGALESVDPFEAATRVTDLMTRLEAGYALTARLQRLSLLNFL